MSRALPCSRRGNVGSAVSAPGSTILTPGCTGFYRVHAGVCRVAYWHRVNTGVCRVNARVCHFHARVTVFEATVDATFFLFHPGRPRYSHWGLPGSTAVTPEYPVLGVTSIIYFHNYKKSELFRKFQGWLFCHRVQCTCHLPKSIL